MKDFKKLIMTDPFKFKAEYVEIGLPDKSVLRINNPDLVSLVRSIPMERKEGEVLKFEIIAEGGDYTESRKE